MLVSLFFEVPEVCFSWPRSAMQLIQWWEKLLQLTNDPCSIPVWLLVGRSKGWAFQYLCRFQLCPTKFCAIHLSHLPILVSSCFAARKSLPSLILPVSFRMCLSCVFGCYSSCIPTSTSEVVALAQEFEVAHAAAKPAMSRPAGCASST